MIGVFYLLNIEEDVIPEVQVQAIDGKVDYVLVIGIVVNRGGRHRSPRDR